MDTDIEDLLISTGGVVRRADHGRLARRLDRARDRGELLSPLPGVLWLPDCATDPIAMARAGSAWGGPDAVVVGHAAAALTFWPELTVEEIAVAVPHRHRRQHARWVKSYRRVPPELITTRHGIAVTDPAATAVDLAVEEIGGEAIDRALRTRTATLDGMWAALTAQPNRIGNLRRTWLLRDSRDQPWSECERELHRLLRRHRIRGWRTNVYVRAGEAGYYGDVVFGRVKLIVEADGWEFHSSRTSFEDDRKRRNELELAGYCVLNFTWRQITGEPDWVIGCIRQAIDGLR